ncbi:hypothetical protein [Streptomyces smyrnaeus]|uniref:hypothetical protein n=1 Tax=Streptomyces smyrnaeus TaxID=1387713 RepID=UPI0033EF1A1C
MLRHDQRLADMAGGNNVSGSTVRRWRDALITLLGAQAPRLDRALKTIARQGRGGGLDRRYPHCHPAPHREGRPAQLLRQNTTGTACTSSP